MNNQTHHGLSEVALPACYALLSSAEFKERLVHLQASGQVSGWQMAPLVVARTGLRGEGYPASAGCTTKPLNILEASTALQVPWSLGDIPLGLSAFRSQALGIHDRRRLSVGLLRSCNRRHGRRGA